MLIWVAVKNVAQGTAETAGPVSVPTLDLSRFSDLLPMMDANVTHDECFSYGKRHALITTSAEAMHSMRENNRCILNHKQSQ